MDARLACSKDHDFFNPDKFGPRYVRVLPATFLEMEELHSKLSANKIDTKRDQDDLLAGNEGKVRATSHGGATHALFLQRTKGKVQKVKKQINKSPSIPPFTFSEQLCPTRLCTTTAMNPVWHGNLVPGLPNQCHLDSGTLHYPINDTTSMRYVVHDLYTGSKVYLQSLTLDTGANNQLPALSEYDGEGSLMNALFQDLFNETCGATMDPSVDLTISETWIDTETQMNM